MGTNPQTPAQDYTGYWRVGGDTTWGGNSSNYFAGTIDEVAVYSTVALRGGRRVALQGVAAVRLPNQAPTAAFTSTLDRAQGVVRRLRLDRRRRHHRVLRLGLRRRARPAPAPPRPTPTRRPAPTRCTLTVTDDERWRPTSKTDTVTVMNTAPTAAFTSSANEHWRPASTARAPADPDGTVASYAWDFGDGATSTAPARRRTTPTGRGDLDVRN